MKMNQQQKREKRLMQVAVMEVERNIDA